MPEGQPELSGRTDRKMKGRWYPIPHSNYPASEQRTFEIVRQYFYKHSENIPMAFVLGFYDERGRLMRRTIVRYAILAYVITLKHVSVRVKKRFPTLQHIVDAGKYNDGERKEDSGDDGRTVPDGKVLDAIGLGHQHHQPGEEGVTHLFRPCRPDPPHGAVGAQEKAWLHHQLRHCLHTPRLHPGPQSLLDLVHDERILINYLCLSH
ncbi:unnamed protein product [Nezara viridula]|uniref:Bestrophin homolog n=1 Tax=Nezara viridula TaxID=85310 RepID=A0A9P0GZJ7_NEZVI|nr:unnamed protein product [Nezara viridula]